MKNKRKILIFKTNQGLKIQIKTNFESQLLMTKQKLDKEKKIKKTIS